MVLLLKHMLWNYKLLFGQTTMGRIHACCRETDYVANTRFLSLVLTQIFRILLRFYSDFTQISAQKIGYWELWCSVRLRKKLFQSDLTGKESSHGGGEWENQS